MSESINSSESVEEQAIKHRSRHEKAAHRIAALHRDVDAAVSFHAPAGMELMSTQSFKDAETVLKDRLTTVDMEAYQHFVDNEDAYRRMASEEDIARTQPKHIDVEKDTRPAEQIDVHLADPEE